MQLHAVVSQLLFLQQAEAGAPARCPASAAIRSIESAHNFALVFFLKVGLLFCKASCFSVAVLANTESPCGSDALNWPLNGCSERVGALHLALSESTLSFLQLLLLLKDEIA